MKEIKTMLSEKTELLSKGLYKDIPDVITLKSLPTSSELEFVGSEDFDKTMLDEIFPQAIEEKFDYYSLLELDYQWICRCLRILNYGPYYTTNTVFCGECGQISNGEFRADLRTVDAKPIPKDFKNDITISADEFIDFEGEVKIKLLTMRETLTAYSDEAFKMKDGKINRELARICYMVTQVGTKTGLTPIEVKTLILRDFSSADYIVLKDSVTNLTDYGLRAGGTIPCPKCGSRTASYIALVDDRFFRPTVGDLKQWRDDKRAGGNENPTGNKTKTV